MLYSVTTTSVVGIYTSCMATACIILYQVLIKPHGLINHLVICTMCIAALHRVWPGLNASNPASSCTQIFGSKPNAPSCNYWLHFSNGSITKVFCDKSLFPCQLGFSEEGGTCRGESISLPSIAIIT